MIEDIKIPLYLLIVSIYKLFNDYRNENIVITARK